MSSTNKLVLMCVVAAMIVVVYQYMGTGHSLIEHFWGGLPMFSPTVDVVQGQTGQSIAQNNQSQLHVNPNPIINTSILSNQNRQLLTDSLSAPTSPAFQAYKAAILPPNTATSSSEYYPTQNQKTLPGKSTIPPTFTVPGTYQSYLSPRFNSEGYNSFVKYNLPEEKYLGTRANDPLMMADRVERRENFQQPTTTPSASTTTFSGQTPYEYNEIYEKQKQQGDDVSSKLPVPTMASGVQENPNIYTNYDRFIFSLQRNRLQGQGDPIRGDLPCVPCNPSSDASSNVWFRPSVNVATNLRTGAINVIAGIGNVTSQQTAELQMRALGGAKDTFGGVALPLPNNTPVSNLQAIQQAQLNTINMGNSIDLTADRSNPISTVNTVSFP